MKTWINKKDNRGFSLIELIVSLAVASIVILAIGTLMSVGTRSYYSTNTETELQKESQIAMNQLNDLLIKTQDYKYLTDFQVDGVSVPILVITGSEDDDVGNAVVYYYVIIFDKSRNQLLFRKSKKANFAPITMVNLDDWLHAVVRIEVQSTTPSLLAKYIQELTISPTNSTSDNQGVVQVTLDLALGEKTYSTFSSISFRNK
jgi:prepilin-type N-terminal cleavage/methylation domain-containing protein